MRHSRQPAHCASITARALAIVMALAGFFTATPLPARAQQPFVTDDVNVTPRGRFHFEFSNQFSRLPPASFPNRLQNSADFELSYGLLETLEVSLLVPVITIHNAPGTAPLASGVGDVGLTFKYYFYKARRDSPLPDLAVTLAIEPPSGDYAPGLGSGLTDYHLNAILQTSLSDATTLRVNGGLLYAGQKTPGLPPATTRGLVFTGGASLVKAVSDRLALGAEVTGAATRNLQLGRGQLQAQFGGNYAVRKNCTLDFGVLAGRFAGSPRLGAQIGLSLDF